MWNAVFTANLRYEVEASAWPLAQCPCPGKDLDRNKSVRQPFEAMLKIFRRPCLGRRACGFPAVLLVEQFGQFIEQA